jgi:ABC-type amino acid transport substrate-binding protein
VALVAVPLQARAESGAPTLVPGVLTVGLRASAPRFQTGTLDGKRVLAARGFEADLARALAAQLGLRVQFLHVAHGTAFLSSGAKAWDVGLDRISEDQAAAAGVTEVPYLDVLQGVLLRRGLGQPVRSLSDLRWLRLCAERRTAGARLVETVVRPVEAPRLAADETSLLGLLAGGFCDAAVADAPALAAARVLTPGRYGLLAGRLAAPEERRHYVLALPAGSPLAPLLRQALGSLEQEGVVRALGRKWLGVDQQQLTLLRPVHEITAVTLIGDSVSAALNYSSPARTLLSRGLRFRFEGRPCRRLAAPSCGNPPPPTALETIASEGQELGQVVVMDIGYNDSAPTYAVELDTAMERMLRAGVRHVIWVTLEERFESYRLINQAIRAAQRRWPQIAVADWNAYSAGRPWFASDGLHLNAEGAFNLARLLRPFLAPVAAGSSRQARRAS